MTTTRVIIAPVLMLMMWRHSLHYCHLEPIEADDYLDCMIDLLTRGLEVPPTHS